MIGIFRECSDIFVTFRVLTCGRFQNFSTFNMTFPSKLNLKGLNLKSIAPILSIT